ncbi:MAG: hypothetical protein ACYCPV_02190 [Thermoplasmata archaeon]
MDRRTLPVMDLEVSRLGLDLTGPLPPYGESVLHRALHDEVTLFRIPLGDAGRGARHGLRRVGLGSEVTLVLVGVLPPGSAAEAPRLLDRARQELSIPHRLLLEVREPDLTLVRSTLLAEEASVAPAHRTGIGVGIDPPLTGGAGENRADFVSVPHSLWGPGIRLSPDSGFRVGILARDPWGGPAGLVDPLEYSPNPTRPPLPVPVSRLRKEAERWIGWSDLVRLEGRPLPEIAVRYALDTPGVSAALLPLPTPELWLAARNATTNGPLSARAREWILRQGPAPDPRFSPEGAQP